MFEVDNIVNAAIPRDVLNVLTWQRQKQGNSARFPHNIENLFCETSSIFQVDNIKDEAILRDFLQK